MKLSIFIEYSVLCDRCGARNSTENKAAKRIFRRGGWKIIKGETVCPGCVKKANKPN